MSDEEDRRTDSLIPLAGGEIVSRSTSLVRRGLNLRAAERPAEDATTTDDVRLALRLRLAAEQGDADAQLNLGAMCSTGRGVQQDVVQAAYWYGKAAEPGNANAQRELGYAYLDGEGVAQDGTQSVQWFRKAAEQGDADAQEILARSYFHGWDVLQDAAQAVQWFRRAVEQGNAGAKYGLGLAYLWGRGVPQDYVEAHKWMNLAAALTSDAEHTFYADGRESVAKKMTPDQLSEAQTRARKWTEALDEKKK